MLTVIVGVANVERNGCLRAIVGDFVKVGCTADDRHQITCRVIGQIKRRWLVRPEQRRQLMTRLCDLASVLGANPHVNLQIVAGATSVLEVFAVPPGRILEARRNIRHDWAAHLTVDELRQVVPVEDNAVALVSLTLKLQRAPPSALTCWQYQRRSADRSCTRPCCLQR